jgi:nucleoside-diphosphate-sugar epimerase
MKTLIIGSGGYIGSACARAMRAAGHEVSGLARNAEIEARLAKDGYGALRGDLSDIAPLARAVLAFDAVLYTPRVTFAEEGQSLGPLVAAFKGTGKTFIYTSGTGVMNIESPLGEWRHETFSEGDAFTTLPWIQQRVEVENKFLSEAQRGVRAMLLRPPHVWGHGNSTLVRGLVEGYRKTGEVNYVGLGLHQYASVHVDDLGEISRLVLERGEAGGVYNAVGGEVNLITLARATAKLLGCEARSVTLDEAKKIWGDWMAPNLYAVACPARGPKARALGWAPQHHDIEVDIRKGGYEAIEVGEDFDAATQKRFGVIKS